MSDIRELLKTLNIVPHNIDLYVMAFTHPSFNGEVNTHHKDYERLEFIGDSVVGFTVADLIYKQYSEQQEGIMTKIRSALVQSESLAEHARRLGLGQYIRLGNGLKQNGGCDSQKILEDVFEALTGAIYLDQSIEVAYLFLRKQFLDEIVNFTLDQFTDYKTRLQEEMQSDNRGNVYYKIVGSSGPAHKPVFEAEVYFNEVKLGRGKASSKKEAEQLAAKDALEKKAVI